MVPTSPGAWPFWPGCLTASVCRQFMSSAQTSIGKLFVDQAVTLLLPSSIENGCHQVNQVPKA